MDVNSMFSRAEALFRSGDHAGARMQLLAVLKMMPEAVVALHLLALCEARLGNRNDADAAYRRALRLMPGDAQIRNNFGNFLKAGGDLEGALAQYDAALGANPALHPARLNRATALVQIDRAADALADVTALRAVAPEDAGLRLTAGAAYLKLGRLAEAAADFDAVLAARPDDVKALQGRARAAAQTGEEERAVALYRRALALAPGDPEIALGLAEALEAGGMDGAEPTLAAAVTANPRWVPGQDALARMRAEAGAGDDFDAGYREARRAMPGDAALAMGHAACLMRADRPAAALAALDGWTARAGRSASSDALEAMLASEAGDIERADAAFLRAGAQPGIALARGRHLLRKSDAQGAAALLEPAAFSDLGAVSLWAHLGLAWRLVGDARHAWLDLQPGLVGTQAIDVDVAALAAELRGLHRSRAHPIGQSLRGGTQTRGHIFGRNLPQIRLLEGGLRAAVRAHMAGMPGHDATHPLLRHQGRALEFAGSWSVRLADGGFHVAHVHPEGVLSSAFYVAVPEAAGQDGWLEVGAPPVELGLDLAPLHMIQPVPGRLALFPSTMFHGTRPFKAGERLTVAFDLRV
jgi:Tfp pilus assembly protein PilF